MSGAVLILGARSDIARACARRFAQGGHPLVLAARGAERLAADKADLELRFGVAVTLADWDATDIAATARLLDHLPDLPEVVICAAGAMGDQRASEADPEAAAAVLAATFAGPALALGVVAERFAARGRGTIVGISSVAGERGRASNYVYGSAKAGLTAFLSGLRNRFARSGVRVVTVLPGFVDTAMTEGLDLPGPLVAQPEEVAQAIWRAVRGRRDVVWVRPVWRLVMAIIRALPEPLFKRTRL